MLMNNEENLEIETSQNSVFISGDKPIISSTQLIIGLGLISATCFLALYILIFTEDKISNNIINLLLGFFFLTLIFMSQFFIIKIIYFELLFRQILKKSIIRTYAFNSDIIINEIKKILNINKNQFSILTLNKNIIIKNPYIPWIVRPVIEIIKIKRRNIYIIIRKLKKSEFGVDSQIIIGPISRKNNDLVFQIDKIIQSLTIN